MQMGVDVEKNQMKCAKKYMEGRGVGERKKSSKCKKKRGKMKTDHGKKRRRELERNSEQRQQEKRHTPQLAQPHEEQSPAQEAQLEHEHGDMLSFV